MNFIDDCDISKGKYCIIEEHELEEFEGLEGLDNVEIIDIAKDIAKDNMNVTVSDVLGGSGGLSELSEVEFIEAVTLEGCEKLGEHETQQMREINQNSYEKEKSLTVGVNITVEFREVEVTINTSTVEEVIFKKHRVEIINKRSRACIMEGVVTGYQLVGRVYDPDIVLEFEDGRTFYNDNFGYNMLFYI